MYWRRFRATIFRPEGKPGFLRPRQYKLVGICCKSDYPNFPAIYQGVFVPRQGTPLVAGDLVVFEDRELGEKLVFKVDARGELVLSRVNDPGSRFSCTM